MEGSTNGGDPMPIFYVGQHETKRALPVTDDVVRQAQDSNYDMLTTPITSPHFHSSVLNLVSAYMSKVAGGADPAEIPTPLVPPLTPADTPLTPSETISQLIAYTSAWIDLASPDPIVAHISQQVFNAEIAYAAFCGVVNVVIQGPKLYSGTLRSNGLSQFARAIQEALNLGPYIQLHILLPMSEGSQSAAEEADRPLASFARKEFSRNVGAQLQNRKDPFGTWDAWNVVRTVCKYNSRLSVALTLPRHLSDLNVQSRWYSEPLRILSLPATSFLANARGYPVLSKPHQIFIARCMRLRTPPWLLLVDVGPIAGLDDPNELVPVATGLLSPSVAADAPSASSSLSPSPTPVEASQILKERARKSKDDPTPHLSYIRYLQRNQPPKTIIERFGAGYQDYLQSPLQPLADNLESITYEVFEKDPVKYDWYERAITRALLDWQEQSKPTSSLTGAVVIAIVGSGRGPLVTRAIRASRQAGVAVEVYAIEKNPNAYVLLQRHNLEDWDRIVTVVKTDMRAWKGPQRADGSRGHVDIIVSELLGSFADNELSPECLDGVQHVLNPSHGISIPKSYSAHLTPIAAPKLFADISARSVADSSVFDMPYVVMLHAIDYLSLAAVQPSATGDSESRKGPSQIEIVTPTPAVETAWTFVHPIPLGIIAQSNLRRGGSVAGGRGGVTGGDGANEHNTRFSHTKFDIKDPAVCHGIAGYFETVLYEGSTPDQTIELSTNPVTMDTKSRDMISWFPIFFPLKNPMSLSANSEIEVSMWRLTDDRKVWYEWLVESFITVGDTRMRIGISELHTCKKNGCLM